MWDGKTDHWAPLGVGIGSVNVSVNGLAFVKPKKNQQPKQDEWVIAGGYFEMTGPTGQQINNIAMWDGTTWSPLGQGVSGQFVGTATLYSVFLTYLLTSFIHTSMNVLILLHLYPRNKYIYI